MRYTLKYITKVTLTSFCVLINFNCRIELNAIDLLIPNVVLFPLERWCLHLTIQEAAQCLGKSEATIRRAIKAKKLESILIDGRYEITEEALSVYAKSEELSMQTDRVPTHNQVDIEKLKAELERTSSENQRLRQEIKQAYDWLKEKDAQIEDSRERQDTIIMQLSRQLGDTQKALEMKNMSWWKKLRLGKGKEEK